MKQIALWAVLVSTSMAMLQPGQVAWGIFGLVDVSTVTPATLGVSTGTIQNVILKSQTTSDCYRLTVTPNGTIGTEWIKCP